MKKNSEKYIVQEGFDTQLLALKIEKATSQRMHWPLEGEKVKRLSPRTSRKSITLLIP